MSLEKALKPARRRDLVAWIHDTYATCTRRTCELAQFSQAGWYRKSTAKDKAPLRRCIKAIALMRPRFGYQRIHVMLRREGWIVNYKRVHRLYRLDDLQLRMRVRRRKHMALHRGVPPNVVGPGERLNMDFVHDQLFDGRRFRIVAVVDQWSRESVLLEARLGFSGTAVAELLDGLVTEQAAPASITADHGTEFTSKALEA